MKLEIRGDFLYVICQYVEEKKYIEGFFQASLDGLPFFRLGRRYSSFPYRDFVLDWDGEAKHPDPIQMGKGINEEDLKRIREQLLCGYWTRGQVREQFGLSDEEITGLLDPLQCCGKVVIQPAEDCFAARCALLVNKPKMKMLFLDDRTKRVESARRQFGGKFDLTIVSTVKECLRKLSGEDWDEVHLDHDLNGDDFQNPDSPTAGMEVVRYIVKCGWPPSKRKPIFRVHSSNIFASWLMVRTLHEVGLFAFWERFEYKDEGSVKNV